MGRSIFVRPAARHPSLLAGFLITGFVVGIVYRLLMDPAAERDLSNLVRSGLHGIGRALAIWIVRMIGLASNVPSSFGAALTRLPTSGEILVRSLLMTAALVIVGVSLQFVRYARPPVRPSTRSRRHPGDIDDAAEEGAPHPEDHRFAGRAPKANRDPCAERAARAADEKEAVEALRHGRLPSGGDRARP